MSVCHGPPFESSTFFYQKMSVPLLFLIRKFLVPLHFPHHGVMESWTLQNMISHSRGRKECAFLKSQWCYFGCVRWWCCFGSMRRWWWCNCLRRLWCMDCHTKLWCCGCLGRWWCRVIWIGGACNLLCVLEKVLMFFFKQIIHVVSNITYQKLFFTDIINNASKDIKL